MNPYKSNTRLWKEKKGLIQPEDISEKDYVQFGTNAEIHMIELFKLDHPEYVVTHDDNNIFTNDKFPFAHASLDGEIIDENGRKGILEIKTSSIKNATMSAQWRNQIPQTYYLQILHYLMVTEYQFAMLKARLKYEFGNDTSIRICHYIIERSEVEDDISYLAEKEAEFWKSLRDNVCPFELLPEI